MVAELTKGDTVPFDGQLMSPKAAATLQAQIEDGEKRTAIEVRRATRALELKLESALQARELDRDYYKRREEVLADAAPAWWTSHAAFVGGVLFTLATVWATGQLQ